jgi:hypothetical protein
MPASTDRALSGRYDGGLAFMGYTKAEVIAATHNCNAVARGLCISGDDLKLASKRHKRKRA